VVDYRFWVVDGRRAEFEKVFGLGGIWQELLARGDSYLGTEVELESVAGCRYRVRDFWSRHLGFELFRERFAAEYEHFEEDLRAEGLIRKHQFVGAYYETLPGDNEGLVLG
jgi:hypothetical protein